MRQRPTSQTLDSLRATLQKLEQTEVPADSPESISELKRVVINRIADLELSQILAPSDDENAEKEKAATAPSELVTPTAATEEHQGDTPADGASIEKLD